MINCIYTFLKETQYISRLSNDKIFDLIGISQATFISGSTRKVFFYKRNTRGVWSDNEAIKNKLHEILDREI